MRDHKLTMPECRKIGKRVFEWFNHLDPYGYPTIDREEIVNGIADAVRRDPRDAAGMIFNACFKFMSENGIERGSSAWESWEKVWEFVENECYVLVMFSATERKEFRERRAL